LSRYAIIDVANLFHRCIHVTHGDAFTKAGMALAIIFNSLRKLHREMQVDHMVFCVEGRSWRYGVYPAYKAKRRADRLSKTQADQEADAVAGEVLNDLITYLSEKTRCTVLRGDRIEGDDFIARWIQIHPDDEHVILSGDSDFVQLLAPNVTIVDGAQERIITLEGIKNYAGEELTFAVNPKDGKIKVGLSIAAAKKAHEAAQKTAEREHIAAEKERSKAHTLMESRRKADDPAHVVSHYVAKPFLREDYSFTPEPDWQEKALFIKIIRGDSGDGIFSSYPGVRYKGSKNTIGIEDAWADRNEMGFNYNNFMLQSWEKLVGADADGNAIKKRVRVMDEYAFNASLIDLTQQPDEIKAEMDEAIIAAVEKAPISQVGIHFLRFCDRQNLPSLTRDAKEHTVYLSAPYAK
jgi:hypothetical protein